MALRADTIREFGELFVRDEPPRAQTHRAVVTAVDGGTVYVDVSGNGDATPIETTSAGYAIGDEVQVEQRGGRLHVSGNVTQPSVGARHVEQAVAPIAKTASQAQSASEAAQKVANEAAEVADATAQHFFDDTDGVHVTEADQEEWTSSHTGKNILINSLGILLRNALNNLVSITASAIAFFDGSGNAASNVVAQFGASGAQIGKSGAAHISMDADSVNMVNQYGTKLFSVDLPEVNQTASYYLSTGASYASSGTFTYIMQPWVGKSGTVTVDIDFYNGSGSTRRYELPIAGIGESKSASHTFGSATYNCTVTWTDARTFTVTVSSQNPASGGGARLTQLRVYFPEDFPEFVFGTRDSTSPAPYASSLGMGANVQGLCQSVLGMYNEADMEKALIIGNGASDNARSNAFMVDWDGYIYPCAEKMPDWVVEQGTSGIWTYRKWHSGVAECWGVHSTSFAVSTSSATYGGYRSAEQTATFPSGLFTSTPSATATGCSGYVGCWVNNAQSTSSTAFKFFASCGTSLSSSSRSTHIHAIGRWK